MIKINGCTFIWTFYHFKDTKTIINRQLFAHNGWCCHLEMIARVFYYRTIISLVISWECRIYRDTLGRIFKFSVFFTFHITIKVLHQKIIAKSLNSRVDFSAQSFVNSTNILRASASLIPVAFFSASATADAIPSSKPFCTRRISGII